MDEIIGLLNPDNTVTINRPLAHELGVAAAIVYSALVGKQAYYERRGMLDSEGWFYSTVNDLEESTALSERRQSTAIKTLAELGLIETERRGLPARRSFRVVNNAAALGELLEAGKAKMTELNPIAQATEENSPDMSEKTGRTSSDKNAEQVAAKTQNKSEQNVDYTYNLNNKSKEIIQINQSTAQARYDDGCDEKDMIDFSLEERNFFLERIHENIEYDYQQEKEKVDELVEIMLDVICSKRDTIRVNGEIAPRGIVRNRFLKLNSSHIDYVLTSLQRNTSEVRNIRAYLITALYNAPTTIDSYYTALVNHDLWKRCAP